ncbi:serine/threonine protein kinase, partial [Saccharothrix sp. MB29]|nr:serine/threonine protein kinase [Saccharothrix sp. MB29]
IAVQALSALDSAHQAGVVHRDVKPGNLMITPNGRVKLTDFGIAQAVDDPRLTTSGSLIGSPAYMSPERIHGHEATPAADLWALGATLAYAVEGVSPYERSSTASTLHAIMNEAPRLTRAHGALGAVITGLLMPTERPPHRSAGPRMLERALAQPTPPAASARAQRDDELHAARQRGAAGGRPQPWLKGVLIAAAPGRRGAAGRGRVPGPLVVHPVEARRDGRDHHLRLGRHDVREPVQDERPEVRRQLPRTHRHGQLHRVRQGPPGRVLRDRQPVQLLRQARLPR